MLTSYEDKVVQAKASLENKQILDKTISVFRVGMVDGAVECSWSSYWGGAVVYDSLGMKRVEAVEEILKKNSSESIKELSYEVLPEFTGDYILVNVQSEEAMEELEKNPVWQSLTAVKNGNVIKLDSAFLYFGDITSRVKQLEAITAQLLAL